jgi:hypothetical protein
MAQHAAIPAVIGERHGAIHALEAFPTGPARDKARKATPVEQQHGLLAILQTVIDGFEQSPRESGLLASLQKLLAHVDEFHDRHGPLLDPLRQLHQSVFPTLDVKAGFETGRG